MTEFGKTGIFAGTAAAIGLLAWATLPKQLSTKDEVEERINKSLFEKFEDPTEVAHLKILKYNEELGSLQKFELSRDASGLWVIPSHDSYPADAASQVSKVANAFIGLKALTVATEKANEQKDFGVVEPDETKELVGETGIGTYVSMENAKGEQLVNLVIGKEVRDSPKQRYVRRTGSDPVFTAEIDPSILNTDFSSWIEGDLLKLSSTDVAAFSIRDYNILSGSGGRSVLKKNFDADINYNAKDAKWEPVSIKVFDKREPTERKLADDEELNTTKLNEIKNTLDSLKIVDVARKPKGLAADLKAEKELLDDEEKMRSLARRGFMAGEGPEGKLEIFSANGELLVKLNDGVEYLLRFGNAIGDLSGESAENAEEKSESKKDSVAIKRTLFVTARLDEGFYPMPELQPVPETVEQLKELDAKEQAAKEAAAAVEAATAAPPAPPSAGAVSPPADAKPADSDTPAKGEAASDKPADTSGQSKEDSKESVESSAEAKEPTEASPPAKPDPDASSSNPSRKGSSVRLVSTQSDSAKESKEATPAGRSDSKQEEPSSPATESAKSPATKDEAETSPKKEETTPSAAGDDSAKPAEPAPAKVETAEELKERLEATRERITKENTRLLDDRKDRMEKARKKAAELNARFADWYYEIGDAEYARLRASLDDLIQKKSAIPPAATPSAGPGLPSGFPGLPPN